MTTRRPRALVVLHETGYFRMYGSVVCEMERRGWDVVLAFDTPDKRDAPQVPVGAARSPRPTRADGSTRRG